MDEFDMAEFDVLAAAADTAASAPDRGGRAARRREEREAAKEAQPLTWGDQMEMAKFRDEVMDLYDTLTGSNDLVDRGAMVLFAASALRVGPAHGLLMMIEAMKCARLHGQLGEEQFTQIATVLMNAYDELP